MLCRWWLGQTMIRWFYFNVSACGHGNRIQGPHAGKGLADAVKQHRGTNPNNQFVGGGRIFVRVIIL